MSLVVVMGVTGSGKSTVGIALAEKMGVPFADADDFHPPENVAKMRSGTALTDVDRRPWLLAIGAWLARQDDGAVVTCSALKRVYRDTLREAAPTITFLHLHGDRETVRARVGARQGHFMPQSLVDSQFADLEPLGADEDGVVVDLALPVDVIVERFLE